MIKNGEFIHEMKKRGMNITQIADELGRDRKTIRKWLQKSELVPCQRQITRPGKLEPFKDYIRQRMREGCLNANVIFDEDPGQRLHRPQNHFTIVHAATPPDCHSKSHGAF